MAKKILIIIPCYNEEENILKVISEIQKNSAADILVVNDGSDDKTSELAMAGGAKVLRLPFNLGYGACLQTGFIYAQREGYDFVVQMDGDGQHNPKDINTLLSMLMDDIDHPDIVIGSRFLQGKGYQTPCARWLGMIIFNTITSFILHQKITDSTSGFQAMNRKIIEFYASIHYPSDYPDADILILLHRMRFKIREIGVTMYSFPDKKSMHQGIIKPMYYVFKMFLSILTTLLRKK